MRLTRNGQASFFAFLALAVALSGCGPRSGSGSTPAPSSPANGPADPWVLSTNDPSNPTPALLWNGLIGLRIGRSAQALGENSGMFLIDQYQTEGEEKIIEQESPLRFIGPANFIAATERIRDYRQTLDMRTGVLDTTWTQYITPPDGPIGEDSPGYRVHNETILHPTKRVVGSRWGITAFNGGELPGLVWPQPYGKSDSFSGGRSWTGWYKNLYRFAAREYSEPNSEAIPKSAKSWYVLSLGRSPNGRKMRFARQPVDIEEAPNYDKPEPPPTFDELKKQTAEYWTKAWQTDVEIDGPVEDQQAVRSFLFYLRSAIHPDGQMAISPFGLSNAKYNGHVFWDADIWVFPALALIDPERAKAITQYRLSTMDRARGNGDEWVWKERPTAHGKLGGMNIGGKFFDLKFPWESSVTGRETAIGESRFEDHISGSVAFAAGQAKALGLVSQHDADVLLSGVEGFFRHRMERQPDGSMAIRDTMSPDEFHTGDNDLYTNLLVDRIWRSRRPANSPNLVKMKLPQDATSFLTYDNDPVKTYKQAAAVLAIYPLQYPPAEKQAKVMMERFADKITPNGPAMSDSVHALIWARIGETDKAYATWKKSWQRYTGHPLMLFSEKPGTSSPLRPSSSGAGGGGGTTISSSSKAGGEGKPTYFTTGAAGCLQTVLYGFLGFRIDSGVEPGAVWSMPLKGGQFLSVRPHLPKEWKRVTLKNFVVLGKRYTLTVDHQSARVTPGD